MKINRNNYEQYFLDFAEGKLNPALQAEFDRFLEANPDLKNELEEFENISVSDNQEIKFNRKSSLKKNFVSAGKINENNYENFLVGEIENDLNEKEKENLNVFVSKNSFIEREQKLFRQTILSPDKKIIFQNKQKLRKTAVIRIGWQQTTAAVGIAASILLLLYFNFRESTKNVPVAIGDVRINESKNFINEKTEKKEKGKHVKEHKQENTVVAQTPTKEKFIRHKNTIVRTELAGNSQNPVIDSLPFAVGNQIAENNSEEKFEKKINENVPEFIAEENFAELKTENPPEDGFVHLANRNPDSYREKAETSDSFTLKEFLAFSFKKNVLKENIPKEKRQAKITPFDLASAAVKGFSKIFGSDIKMKKSYKDNGELAAVAISSPRFEISQTLHKK